YMNAHIDFKHDHGGGVYLQHLSKLPGDRGSVYKDLNGDGIIRLSDTLVHNIVIDVRDAYGNSSVLRFGLPYSDSLAALDKPQYITERFAPNRESGRSSSDFIFNMPARALYDSVPKVYSKQPSSAVHNVTAVHRLTDDSYPVHGNVEVRI